MIYHRQSLFVCCLKCILHQFYDGGEVVTLALQLLLQLLQLGFLLLSFRCDYAPRIAFLQLGIDLIYYDGLFVIIPILLLDKHIGFCSLVNAPMKETN